MKHSHNFKDVTGHVFGYLTAVRPVGVKSYYSKSAKREIKRSVWLFKCVCGNDIERTRREVTNSTTKSPPSCGCKSSITGPNHGLWKGHGEISKTYFMSLQRHATKRGRRTKILSFNLTIEYLWDLFLKQNRKCALSGEDLIFGTVAKVKQKSQRAQTASLDRIDSSKGYVEGNVQWIHKTINKMKQDLSQNDFIKWCRKITSKHQ